MEATESYKSNFGLLRKWVIEPAVAELTEKIIGSLNGKALSGGVKQSLSSLNLSEVHKGIYLNSISIGVDSENGI